MYITGFGYCLPEQVVTNNDLSRMVDTNDEWIRSRTGISARRLASPGQNCSDLATEAARMALEAAGLPPEAVTHIIVCTVSPDGAFPSTACFMQQKLGITKAMSFDLAAACSGFLYSLQVAKGQLAIEPDARILVVGAETLSRLINWKDRGTCVLFGDGAGAVVLSAEANQHPAAHPLAARAFVEGLLCRGNGKGSDLLYCAGGGSMHAYKEGDIVGTEYFIQMNGQEVFKHAVRSMSGICVELLEKMGYSIDDVDLVVPHQANSRIINAVLDRLGVPAEKSFINLDKYGNTSAASIPIALAEALACKRIRPGMRVLMTTFGAGLTWGAALVRFA